MYWSASESDQNRRGPNNYSGTTIWSKSKPNKVMYAFKGMTKVSSNNSKNEGRYIEAHFENNNTHNNCDCGINSGKFVIINVYAPNAGSNLEYRINSWEPYLLEHIDGLIKENNMVILCGDLNVAYDKNDVWFGKFYENQIPRPTPKSLHIKQQMHNGNNAPAGYTLEERESFLKLKNIGLVDCFRYKHPSVYDEFTWYNIRMHSSFDKNQGWLIDRFLTNKAENIQECRILKDTGIRSENGNMISDHVPILLSIKI